MATPVDESQGRGSKPPRLPALRFISLFVPDLAQAVATYAAVLGCGPSDRALAAPRDHPFACAGPVEFDLGPVRLALYQCDLRATHPGDVGLGMEVDPSPHAVAERAAAHGGQVFFGPRRLAADGRELAVFVLPDRHFFEVLGPPGGGGRGD